jgi:hypothetical protein
MATRMQQRRGTAAQWISSNSPNGPILNAGEIGWESDTNKFKIGDGVSYWADLDYFSDINSTVNPAFGSSITFEGATADAYETVLQVTDPTADRTITLPNVTGTVITTGNLSDITNIGVLTSTIVMEGSTADAHELTISAGDPTADRTITFPDATGTVALVENLVTSLGSTYLVPADLSDTVAELNGSGNLLVPGASIIIEGATANDFETTLTVTDPTADRTLTLPDATDTLVGRATTDTLTNKTLTSPVIAGASVTGHIVPATNDTYDLGSASYMWRDIYVGPGSLYVNGQKVLQTVAGDVIITADPNENLALKTSGSGNVELDPTGTGVVSIKGALSMEAGSNIASADGNAVTFGGAISADSMSSKTANTDLSLTANGTGKVYLNDNAEVSGNLVVGGNLTISGTTTSVNTETISLADNIIDLNSNFTTGTPTENAGLRILRGDSANVQVRWNESSDVWDFTNDGTNYSAIAGLASPTFTGTATIPTLTLTNALSISNGGTGATTAMTAATALLPAQTSNSGKYLTTDGSGTLSWGTVSGYSAPTLGSTSIASGATVTTISGLVDIVLDGPGSVTDELTLLLMGAL